MATVFHARLYGRFIEINSSLRRKKLHRTNQGSSFLKGTLSNRENERTTIQLREERKPHHLKKLFVFKIRPIHLYIISTKVARPI